MFFFPGICFFFSFSNQRFLELCKENSYMNVTTGGEMDGRERKAIDRNRHADRQFESGRGEREGDGKRMV